MEWLRLQVCTREPDRVLICSSRIFLVYWLRKDIHLLSTASAEIYKIIGKTLHFVTVFY